MTAATIVYAKGLLNSLLPGEFDQIFGPVPIDLLLKYHNVSAAQAELGDWGYLRNGKLPDSEKARDYFRYHPHGDYQGENVIKVSNTDFWGWGSSVKTIDQWKVFLVDQFNTTDKVSRTIPIMGIPLIRAYERIPVPDQITVGTITGWVSEKNQFFDIPKTTMKIFDFRRQTSGR